MALTFNESKYANDRIGSFINRYDIRKSEEARIQSLIDGQEKAETWGWDSKERARYSHLKYLYKSLLNDNMGEAHPWVIVAAFREIKWLTKTWDEKTGDRLYRRKVLNSTTNITGT